MGEKGHRVCADGFASTGLTATLPPFFVPRQRLPPLVEEQREKLKNEMMGKAAALLLRIAFFLPVHLSTFSPSISPPTPLQASSRTLATSA